MITLILITRVDHVVVVEAVDAEVFLTFFHKCGH